jgi:hypothetical protein
MAACIAIELDPPSSTNVSTHLCLDYLWTSKVRELRPYEEGSLVSFLQENPNIDIVCIQRSAMEKREIVLPEEQDNDEQLDNDNDGDEMLDDDHDE